jgi:Na+-exporting ATPase
VMIPTLIITEQEKTELTSMVEQLSHEGLRVVCVATKVVTEGDEHCLSDRAFMESNLIFRGLVGIYDPPRIESPSAVQQCHKAGIAVHMLTGDHLGTATAIAEKVGILKPGMQAGMRAQDFDKLSDAEIDAMPSLPVVLARCSPSTKVRMVDALKRRKAFCVMTGDGVNDAPALKRADVGISMGKNGTDVAREASAMSLTDDNFASIVKAVEEGRRLFDNIQKVPSLPCSMFDNC